AERDERRALPAAVVEEGADVGHEVVAAVAALGRPVGVAVATLVEGEDVVITRQVGRDLVPAVRGLRAAVEEQHGRLASGAPVEEVEAEAVERRGAVGRGGDHGSGLARQGAICPGSRAALTPGTVVKLFTGSVIPPGADTVVKVEDTEERDGWVVVRAAPAPGANVRPAGEDIRPGQVVVAAGTAIGPADLGVLASVGCATLVVHRRPRVAILPTGAELVEVGEPPGPGQVVNSNAYSLAAAAREAGAEPLVLPIAR